MNKNDLNSFVDINTPMTYYINMEFIYKVVNNQIFLIYVYTKKKKSDLSEQEKKLFGEIAREFAK